MRGSVKFAYRTGWRKNEILGLRWNQVDLKEQRVRLDAGDTRNDEERIIYLDDELVKLLRVQWSHRIEGCDYVFHNRGFRIEDFRKVWRGACKKTGIEGEWLHDFRRMAVRNLRGSGIQESVGMKGTGHKLRTVFDRYDIVSKEDPEEAPRKQHAYLGSGG